MSDYVLRIEGREYHAAVKELTSEQAVVSVDGTEYQIELVQLGRRASAPAAPRPAAAPVSLPPAASSPRSPLAAGEGAVTAPMPGMVLTLKVRQGDRVQAGQALLVMEAMKMENVIAAPFAGVVSRVHVHEGDAVGEGDRLVELDRPKMTAL